MGGGVKLLEAITFLSFPLPAQSISNSNQIINVLCVALHWENFDCDYEIAALLMKTNVIRFWSHASSQAETGRWRGRGEVLVLNAAKHLQRASAIKARECVATSADRCGCRGYCCL